MQDLLQNNVFASSSSAVNHKRPFTVPFVFQSPASGINERGIHQVLWYEREEGRRVLLRFGVCLAHGSFVGGHRGGHVPFQLDITDVLESQGCDGPRGKQYWGTQPESISYTPSGGIWQSVCPETVPAARIADSSHGTVIRSNDVHAEDVHFDIAAQGLQAGHRYVVHVKEGSGKFSLSARLSEGNISALSVSVLQNAPLDDASCWRNIALTKKDANDEEESRDWGYTTAIDLEDLLKRIERIVKGDRYRAGDERALHAESTRKLDAAKVKAVFEEAAQMFYERVNA
ncbi:hypothetical protein ACQKWADRAFT_313562 [Trichoderma austrokoningii]